MKLLIDENIPLAQDLFSEIGEVKTISGRDINNTVLTDNKTEVLIVRSITKVDRELLKNTDVKFVGTATIGTDHIDLNYLKENNIGFSNAAGSNADSVVEYIFSAIFNYYNKSEKTLNDLTIGIVGVGNIGSRLYNKLQKLGAKVLLNDPPRKDKGDNENFLDLHDLTDADIITIHTPLTKSGEHPTFHLFDSSLLKKLRKETLLINAARGSVINNNALLKLLTNNSLQNVILDVWENEPAINTQLLKKVIYGTPHIAGYSYDGKINGAVQIFNAVSKFFNLNHIINTVDILEKPEKNIIKITEVETYFKTISRIINKVYDIKRDNELLKNYTPPIEKYFDQLRKEYPIRREFHNFTVILPGSAPKIYRTALEILGFNVE